MEVWYLKLRNISIRWHYWSTRFQIDCHRPAREGGHVVSSFVATLICTTQLLDLRYGHERRGSSITRMVTRLAERF